MVLKKNIHINGYMTEKIRSSNTGLGLLIDIRKNTNLIFKIPEKDNNVIGFTITNNIATIEIITVYKHGSGLIKKFFFNVITKLLSKYENNKKIDYILICDDWN